MKDPKSVNPTWTKKVIKEEDAVNTLMVCFSAISGLGVVPREEIQRFEIQKIIRKTLDDIPKVGAMNNFESLITK